MIHCDPASCVGAGTRAARGAEAIVHIKNLSIVMLYMKLLRTHRRRGLGTSTSDKSGAMSSRVKGKSASSAKLTLGPAASSAQAANTSDWTALWSDPLRS